MQFRTLLIYCKQVNKAKAKHNELYLSSKDTTECIGDFSLKFKTKHFETLSL